MICQTCKFCTFINESKERIKIRDEHGTSDWINMTGSHCILVATVMLSPVLECSSYEKAANGRKIKIRK